MDFLNLPKPLSYYAASGVAILFPRAVILAVLNIVLVLAHYALETAGIFFLFTVVPSVVGSVWWAIHSTDWEQKRRHRVFLDAVERYLERDEFTRYKGFGETKVQEFRAALLLGNNKDLIQLFQTASAERAKVYGWVDLFPARKIYDEYENELLSAARAIITQDILQYTCVDVRDRFTTSDCRDLCKALIANANKEELDFWITFAARGPQDYYLERIVYNPVEFYRLLVDMARARKAETLSEDPRPLAEDSKNPRFLLEDSNLSEDPVFAPET